MKIYNSILRLEDPDYSSNENFLWNNTSLISLAWKSMFMSNDIDRTHLDLGLIYAKIQRHLGLAIEFKHLPLDKSDELSLHGGKPPANGCFYISHLTKDGLYIPLEDYNKHLAQEKNIAFRKLAAALGAKSILLEEANIYNSEGKLETDFILMQSVAIDIGIKVNFAKDGTINSSISSTFENTNRKPDIPKNLQRWVDTNSDLELMASHRLEDGLLSHTINLEFSEDINGAAEAAARIIGTNQSVGAGVSGSKHTSSCWMFTVDFHPMYNH